MQNVGRNYWSILCTYRRFSELNSDSRNLRKSSCPAGSFRASSREKPHFFTLCWLGSLLGRDRQRHYKHPPEAAASRSRFKRLEMIGDHKDVEGGAQVWVGWQINTEEGLMLMRYWCLESCALWACSSENQIVGKVFSYPAINQFNWMIKLH